MTFVNISNHPSNKWSEKQLSAATQTWGEVIDIAFPNVPSLAGRERVLEMASLILEQIPATAKAVMVQGEFSLTYHITKALIEKGATVVVACSDRNVKETVLPDGTTKKDVVFEFAGFRQV